MRQAHSSEFPNGSNAQAATTTFVFVGGAATLLGALIIGSVVTALTLGLFAPWAYVLVDRWKAKNTRLNGHELSFEGSATGLFGHWVKWLILTAITFGIYGFWVVPRLTKWRVENQAYAADRRTGRFQFDGGAGSYWLVAIAGWIITVCTFGVCAPWAFVILERWKAEHTMLDGRRLRFTGSAIGLFGHWIKWLALTVITLGIYGFWVVPRLTKWRVENQTFA